MGSPLVGILAIQGDFEAHGRALERLGARTRRVLRDSEIAELDALVLPGGESTTISKGIERLSLWEPLREFAASGRPLLGTCAGAILLSRRAESPGTEHDPVPTLGVLDAVAARNAYGTQVDSFKSRVDPGAAAGLEGFECTFIRAPVLTELGPEVEVLARVEGRPVLVRQQNVWASCFHPELGLDGRVQRLWLGL
ncbi:MAG: pyridoxal 5'-phosphate synthase glutaminase subunit PdxT [Myxococcota bacterium]|nr:pyridoxal 5'-phosphate synthase glutaminase subunit PdxT [Myxococcota bacterium]